MRLVLTLILTVVVMSALAQNNDVLRYWHVTGASSLEIHGTSNVTSFVCASAYSKGKDLITERLDPVTGKWEIHGEVFLDVKGFDCRNRVMNSDFQATLQAETYPEIKVEFVNLTEVNTIGSSRKAAGYVEITLVGKTKRYPIISDLVLMDNYNSILKGEQIFRFSDFGLEPPQKGFGLVKVRDEITVSFELKLDQVMLTDL